MFFSGSCKPGLHVVIVEDCRDEVDATGQVGIMLGNFPRSVFLVNCGEVTDFEMGYDDYISGRATITYTLEEGGPKFTKSVKDLFALKDNHTELESDSYAVVMYNPCIELPDGTKIWGDECWWEVYDPDKSLEESKKDLRKFKDAITIYLAAYELGSSKLDDRQGD